MRLNTLLAAAAIAAMTAGAAAAQDMAAPSGSDTTAAPPANTAPNAPMDNSSMGNSSMGASAAPSADQNAMPAAATMPGQTVESSPTPAANAYTLKAGDPNVVSNQPVPDTKANRAAYGKPMSNAGRHTAASGD